MKNLTTRFAKWLFAIPMLVFGLFHFMNADAMAGAVPIPGGVFWVYFTGLALLAAAVAIVSGKMAKTASLLLALMLVIFAFSVHLPGIMNPDTMQISIPNFFKDLALAAGALVIAGISKDK